MSETLFQDIIAGKIPAQIIHEDDDVVGFLDVNPQAPVHALFVPRQHIRTTNDLTDAHAALLGKMVLAATSYAKAKGLADDGYRLVMNCNEHGGQSVFHIHLHLLGGRQMQWPPG